MSSSLRKRRTGALYPPRRQHTRLYRGARAAKRRGGKSMVKSFNSRINGTSISANRMKWHGQGFVPVRFDTIMDYGYFWKFTEAAGFYDWVIRANSIFDPDVAVGGDSCTGLDQISGIYKHYKVSGCAVELSIVNNDTDDPVNVCIIPNNFSASYAVANINSIIAMPYAKNIIVANQAGAGRISHYMASKVMFDVANLDSVNFSAATDANPGTIWYFHICIFNHSGNALNVETKFRARYYTEFSELTAFNQ